jgi:hypothetical protein
LEKDIIRCSSLLKCCCDLSTIRLLLLRSPLALGCFDESRAGRRGGLPQTIYSGAGPCVGTALAILAAAQHSSFRSGASIDPSGVSGPVVSLQRSPPPTWGRRRGCSAQILDPASHFLSVRTPQVTGQGVEYLFSRRSGAPLFLSTPAVPYSSLSIGRSVKGVLCSDPQCARGFGFRQQHCFATMSS